MEENVILINGGIMMNVNVSVKRCHVCEKDYVWNPAICLRSCFENGKYLASTMNDSVITYDEIMESYD